MRPSAARAIRTRLIAALESRAATLDGEARRVLEARVAALQAGDADASSDVPEIAEAAPHRGPLHDLVDHLDYASTPARDAYPDIPALADVRQLWSTFRAERQLQQTAAHVPTDVGPLNSVALAGRAITLMRELSPGYLRHFLAYVDDLAWLEQAAGAGAVASLADPNKPTRKPRR